MNSDKQHQHTLHIEHVELHFDTKNELIEPDLPLKHFSISFDVVHRAQITRLCSTRNELFQQHCFTGLNVNPSAEVLARFIVYQWNSIQNFNIVELGCGIGLSGLITEKLSQISTPFRGKFVLTDGEHIAVDMGKKNLEALAHQKREHGDVQFDVLKWEKESVQDLLQKHKLTSSGFDLAFGADLIYSRIDLNALVQSAKDLLMPREGSVKAIVFFFLPRISDYPERLREIAERLDLHIHFGRIDTFLTSEIINQKFWHNVEMCVFTSNNHENHDVLLQKEPFRRWNLQKLSVREEQEAEDEQDEREEALLLQFNC